MTLRSELKRGLWIRTETEPESDEQAFNKAIMQLNHPVLLADMNGKLAPVHDGTIFIINTSPENNIYPIKAFAPPLLPESLGDPAFKKAHKLKYAYIAGAMARGITSVKMVEKMAGAGMIGFLGAAGLPLQEIEAAIIHLKQSLQDLPFGFNLIHNPNEPQLEAAVVELYLKHSIQLISASAYMDLTLPLVYYRIKGIHRDINGKIVCPNKIIAKVSRIEVARKFFSPPPEKLLNALVNSGKITEKQAELAKLVPVARDLTAEADSGGHTDNRPALALFPTMLALRDEFNNKYNYNPPLRVGLAGGIATPTAAAAAFSMGAAYVLTGSVNQSCVEAGTSDIVRKMLCEAKQADVTMAPSADMFELGVRVQVLKRGTMFPLRASKLYELYNKYSKIEDIPLNQKKILERDYFKSSLEEVWKHTKDFFVKRDPMHIQRTQTDPKYKMALIFRSYLGQSSKWASSGQASRKIDYQIWCGPSMGAFNQWVQRSFLEKPENRSVVTVAMNLLIGAAVTTRANLLRMQGVKLPSSVGCYHPLKPNDIDLSLT
ncbi:trans-AT polyketide synthase, acyltransferase and oxidoreductase domains [Candidatus Magnetomoraceae bacterium gMMP-15]